MLGSFDDKVLIEIYEKAMNVEDDDDEIFNNFISLLKAELEKRGLLKDIS